MIAVGDNVVVGESVVAELTALGSEKNTYKLYCLRCVDFFTVVEIDVIVFGEEKDTDSSAYSSCSFTGHSIEDRYLVAGTIDTYYHACTHCGMAGAKTYKMDGDTIVCD